MYNYGWGHNMPQRKYDLRKQKATKRASKRFKTVVQKLGFYQQDKEGGINPHLRAVLLAQNLWETHQSYRRKDLTTEKNFGEEEAQ